MEKPDSYVDWISDNTTGIVEPDSAKKEAGWGANEKPPYQFFNWFYNIVGRWIRYFETTTPQYDVVIGSGDDCTHATLEAAVADADVGTYIRVFIRENFTGGASATSLTKAGWRIDCAPGVRMLKGTAATGLSVEAADVEIKGLKFLDFDQAGDKAIAFTAAGVRGRVLFCNFEDCDTEVDDASVAGGGKPVVLGSITH